MGISKDLLLVDDDPAVREMFRAVFEMWDYNFEVVSSAYDALYIFDKIDEFKVIITDINMPGKDGIDLVEELLSNGCKSAMVAITGHISEELQLCSHFQAIMPKPVDLALLHEFIERHVSLPAVV